MAAPSKSSAEISNDPVLRRFRMELDKLYGPRLERVILFGSRARGNARADSDYDVAVFLRDMQDRWDEFDRLGFIEADIIRSLEAVVHAMPFHPVSYEDNTALMQEVRQDGIDL